ncbi:hypothetical protein [Lignipirellula cremea]|uniref:Uncharacterized protein n=1 Tax=Lignipirellula cremea TaxID=2528010 RepID=A0A518E0C5_9BACT|nr:hypothetical protein [Lignipirellula cremea]QDU97550.1 hypothetical protein Pla8534_53980 [Lignipirellula cremea]
MTLESQFPAQRFANEYGLVDGVAMHALHGDQFKIPPPVLKKHVDVGHFVELRLDSPRFSVHEEDAAHCVCPSCQGEASQPILSHEHPDSIAPAPRPALPARGWGEDFWVQVTEREGAFFAGVVDNWLVESRLHGLQQGDTILFRDDHLLAVHGSHRLQLVAQMDDADLKRLAEWLGEQHPE